MERQICDQAFNTFEPQTYLDEPERDHMNLAVVRADREQLLDKTDKVHLFVEQKFAHPGRGTPETVTLPEFHDALDVLVQVFEKYYRLLARKTLMGIEPTPQFDTHECLTFPWWEPERRGDPVR